MTTNKIELDVTPHEGEHPVPVGWALFAAGLIGWGGYYLWAYSPSMGGWSQGKALAEEATASGTNLFATILFTLLAALVAGGLLFAAASRKKG